MKVCFEYRGARNVVAYTHGASVLSESGDQFSARLARRIEEDMLAAEFHYQISVVLLTANRVRSSLEQAPAAFRAQPARYRYDIPTLLPNTAGRRPCELVSAAFPLRAPPLAVPFRDRD